MTLLEATVVVVGDFVDVTVVDIVVGGGGAAFVNNVVVALLVVTGQITVHHNLKFWPINVNLRLLKVVDLVVDVDVVDFVVVIFVIVNVVDVALLVVTGHIILSCGQ